MDVTRRPARAPVNGPWRVLVIAGVSAVSLGGFRAACGAQTATNSTMASISGRVLDSSAVPVPGAIIALDSGNLRSTTDSAGRFRFLHDVPPGLRTATIRVVGFAPTTVAIRVGVGEAVYRDVIIARQPAVLPPVRAEAPAGFGKPVRLAYTSRYDRFYERRTYAIGPAMFFTHEDLEAMDTPNLIDVLRRIPHLRIRQDPEGSSIAFPGCANSGITIVLDGKRVYPVGEPDRSSFVFWPDKKPPPVQSVGPLDALGSLRINQVEAMEVYPTPGTLPAELVGDACAGIVIYTR